MKYQFSRSVKFTPEWNGNQQLPETEQLTAVLKPMVIADLLSIMDSIGSQRALGANLSEENRVDFRRVIGDVGTILPKYVEITGLEDDNGPVNIQEVVTWPAYLELAAELLMKVASISAPTEKAEGNSPGQPG